MRSVLVLVVAMNICTSVWSQHGEMEAVNSSQAAYDYAANHMWSEVVILPISEAKWIVNVGEDEEKKPAVGDNAIVRNTKYRLVADTVVMQVQCAVVDFNPKEMSAEVIDSIRQLMVRDFNRVGSFEKVVEMHLTQEEMYSRYALLNETAGQIEEIFGSSFLDYHKGALFLAENPNGGYKFVVFMRETPVEVPSFVVLKARID
jgi:hypothetical protein